MRAFSLTRAKDPSLSIPGGRTDGSMSLIKSLAQNAWFRIWTWIVESISYDDNDEAKRVARHKMSRIYFSGIYVQEKKLVSIYVSCFK